MSAQTPADRWARGGNPKSPCSRASEHGTQKLTFLQSGDMAWLWEEKTGEGCRREGEMAMGRRGRADPFLPQGKNRDEHSLAWFYI